MAIHSGCIALILMKKLCCIMSKLSSKRFTELNSDWRNNLEKHPSEIEGNYNIKRTADSVLLSLFMRNNQKCNNFHAPDCFLSEPNIPEGPEYENISTLYQCTERSLTNCFQDHRPLLGVIEM